MMRFEKLQPRLCLASVWQNPDLRLDVDGSQDVSVVDTVCIFDRIDEKTPLELPGNRDDGSMFYDTSGDMLVTPLDALLIVNALNRYTDPLEISSGLSPKSDPNQNAVVLTDSVQITGQTLGGVRVDLRPVMTPSTVASADEASPAIASVISENDGSFVIEATIGRGRHDFELTATDPLGRTDSLWQTIRRSDLVEDWNAAILNVVRQADSSPPPLVSRNMAMVHTAMLDAANRVNPTFEPYLVSDIPQQVLDAAEASALPEVAAAAAGHMGSVLAYDPEHKVSIDFNHTTYSAIFAPDQTKVVGGRTVRVLAWYDNEWGFSARMADVAGAMGRLLH
jgi:hypothetical protein